MLRVSGKLPSLPLALTVHEARLSLPLPAGLSLASAVPLLLCGRLLCGCSTVAPPGSAPLASVVTFRVRANSLFASCPDMFAYLVLASQWRTKWLFRLGMSVALSSKLNDERLHSTSGIPTIQELGAKFLRSFFEIAFTFANATKATKS